MTWIFKEGLYYEPIPDSTFYSFYAECDALAADTLIEVDDAKKWMSAKSANPSYCPRPCLGFPSISIDEGVSGCRARMVTRVDSTGGQVHLYNRI